VVVLLLLPVDDTHKLLCCADLICTDCPIFWDCAAEVLTGAGAALTGTMGRGCKDIPVIFATVVGAVCNIRIAFDCVLAVVVITCDTVLRFDSDVTVCTTRGALCCC
jgi:hypothetical protein